MTSQINGLGAAIRNANDAVSMISTAEGALEEITEMLQRMREVAVQSGTGTTSEDDRTYLNAEFDELRSEIDRIAMNTEWNGRAILDGAGGEERGSEDIASSRAAVGMGVAGDDHKSGLVARFGADEARAFS